MQILALDPAQVAHAVRRFQAYDNSPAAIARHYRNRGEHARERICALVHALELRFDVDLGALCARFEARNEPGVDAFERGVLELLAEWAEPPGSGGGQANARGRVLIVHIDRVRFINALAAGDVAARRRAQDLVRRFARRVDPV